MKNFSILLLFAFVSASRVLGEEPVIAADRVVFVHEASEDFVSTSHNEVVELRWEISLDNKTFVRLLQACLNLPVESFSLVEVDIAISDNHSLHAKLKYSEKLIRKDDVEKYKDLLRFYLSHRLRGHSEAFSRNLTLQKYSRVENPATLNGQFPIKKLNDAVLHELKISESKYGYMDGGFIWIIDDATPSDIADASRVSVQDLEVVRRAIEGVIFNGGSP